jgi:thioredoxin reductase
MLNQQVEENIYDVTVIGGGPVGIFTAFYGGMRGMKVKVIESLQQLGGQLSALYPEKYIYDIAGFPKVKAQDLVNQLKEQANQFDITVVLERKIKEINKQKDNLFELTTEQGEKHFSRSIIITAGLGAFTPRKLEVEKVLQYENSNIHYFIDQMEQFKDKKVVICGGGDSAVDWALMLEPIAAEVTIVHRRDKFRAHEHSVEQLKNSSVAVKTPFNITDIIGDGEKVTDVILEHTKEGHQEKMEIDHLIVNYGFVSSLGDIKNWGLEIEKNSIVVNSKMETNIKGIYAAGDISSYEGKVKLIAVGFGEAPIAISNAKTYIDPGTRLQPAHSTSIMGEKKETSKNFVELT